jgi:hypothetical protein
VKFISSNPCSSLPLIHEVYISCYLLFSSSIRFRYALVYLIPCESQFFVEVQFYLRESSLYFLEVQLV